MLGEEVGELALGAEEVFGVIGEQGGTCEEEGAGWENAEKGLNLGMQHGRRLIEVEGGVKVEDEGVDVAWETAAEDVELVAHLVTVVI